MRPIKFRVWNGNKIIYSGSNICITENGWTAYDHFTGENIEICNSNESTSVLMQFTGLYDKNGKEVFEGDVLEAFDKSAIVVIEFVCGQFVGKSNNPLFPETQNRSWIQWVVIGNIYETPELLK